jgi:hypothetical protein
LVSDAPLLLMRVYQGTIATIVKLQSDVAGPQEPQANQETALKQVEAELRLLSAREAEFKRLRLEVVQAKQQSELFTKNALAEQVSQDLAARHLSSVQVVQRATRALKPIWPSRSLLIITCILLWIAPLALLVAFYVTLRGEGLFFSDLTLFQRTRFPNGSGSTRSVQRFGEMRSDELGALTVRTRSHMAT